MNPLSSIFNLREEEPDNDLEKCRQHAAANIPVIISPATFI